MEIKHSVSGSTSLFLSLQIQSISRFPGFFLQNIFQCWWLLPLPAGREPSYPSHQSGHLRRCWLPGLYNLRGAPPPQQGPHPPSSSTPTCRNLAAAPGYLCSPVSLFSITAQSPPGHDCPPPWGSLNPHLCLPGPTTRSITRSFLVSLGHFPLPWSFHSSHEGFQGWTKAGEGATPGAGHRRYIVCR